MEKFTAAPDPFKKNLPTPSMYSLWLKHL